MKNIPVESVTLLGLTTVSTNEQSKHGHKASQQDFATIIFHKVSEGLGWGQGFGSVVKAIHTVDRATGWDKHSPSDSGGCCTDASLPRFHTLPFKCA